MGGKSAIAAAVFTLFTGMVFGAVLFNNFYRVSEALLVKYNTYIMILSSAAMFVAGLLLGRTSNDKTSVQYKPLFQGRPQRLGQEGEKLVFSSLKRAGFVKEQEKK